MSVECEECEHDLRGGHGVNCSRHPITKRAEAIKSRLADLDLADFHANDRWLLLRILAELEIARERWEEEHEDL